MEPRVDADCLPIIPQYHRVGENDYVQRTDIQPKLTKGQFINLHKLKRRKRKLKFMTAEVRIYGARQPKKSAKAKKRKATPFGPAKKAPTQVEFERSLVGAPDLLNLDAAVAPPAMKLSFFT